MSEKLSDLQLYDKRLIARNLRKGLLTREALDKRLAEIEDLTEQADATPLDEIMGIVKLAAVDEPASE